MSVCVCLLLAAMASRASSAEYLGPTVVVAAKDGKTLFVANLDAKQVAFVDPAAGKVTKTVAVPAPPSGMLLSPDGATLYVACAAPKSTIVAIDVASGDIKASIPAGHTATGMAIDSTGKRLWVGNRFNNSVASIDLEAKKETASVAVIREPIALVATPDDKTIFVANHLPNDRADSYDVAAVVSMIDTASNQVQHVRLPNGSTGVRGIGISPNGKHVYVTHLLSRYQMPTTQLERGWMNTNALSIFDAAERKYINTVLLDNVDLGAANPWGVASTADGATLCVAHAGTQELSIVDIAGVLAKLATIPEKRPDTVDPAVYAASASQSSADVPNDLAFLVDLRQRVPLLGNGPRSVAVIGETAYVTEYFTDTLAVVELTAKPRPKVRQIALGPKPELTVQRRGEMFFNDAALCFQHWQSCASCHPDSRVDALNWDLMNDGLGNPKNTKNMLLTHRTPPAMSEAVRMTGEEAVRAGIKHIQFAVRPEEDAQAIDEYLKALQPEPSPHLVDGKMSEAAERGKKLFFNDEIGCARCHPEPLYSDLKLHDVGSRGQYDRRDSFDCPTLIESWRTGPYMHDGQYTTMKEVFTKGKHGAKGGGLDKLTPEQIDDLVEFVLSL
jgi:DNA-binding beta-propeller fold protein YncE